MCQWSDCLLKPMHRIFRHIHIEGSEMNRRVTLVAEQIAELKGLSYEEVCEQTTKNAEKLFNLNS